MEDSRQHRLLECPTFAEDREPFQDAIRKMDEMGLEFPLCPVVTVHPETHFHTLLQFQVPKPVVHESFHAFAQDRLATNTPFHIYVDGSCQFPHSPTTRRHS